MLHNAFVEAVTGEVEFLLLFFFSENEDSGLWELGKKGVSFS